MKILVLTAFVFSSLNLYSQAHAQVGLEGFSSGRYEVRKLKKSRTPASENEAVVTDADGVKVKTLKAHEIQAEEKQKEETPAATAIASVDKSAENLAEVQEPTISEQAESLFSNKAEKIYDFYREQIHPDDTRKNKVEIEFSPVAIYNDSSSNYSFRNYHSYFNALKFKSNVWFTPLIGVSGQMLFSFAADLDSLNSNKSKVPAKYEMLDIGLNFRRFFGMSRRSNSLEFSLLYTENKLNVASDNTSRSRLKSQGIGLGLKARIPMSFTYAWTVGGSFFPRIQHEEIQTGLNMSSGSIDESIRLGIELGGEWKFDRESQMVWNLGVTTERNMFGGTVSITDPSTGLSPSNVGVTNSLYMFSLGYRWGH